MKKPHRAAILNVVLGYIENRCAQTIFYSLTAEYEKMLNPFFEILDKNKILETT
jgi:hypothetical protein